MSKMRKTGTGTHVATERGYVGGVIIEAGEAIPAEIPFSPHWMKEGKPEEAPAVEAPAEA